MAELYKSAVDVREERAVMLNSAELQVGEYCILSPGGVEEVDAVTDRITGLVTGFVTPDGVTIDQAPAADFADGTWVTGSRKYTAASDNQTDEMIQVVYRPIMPGDIYSAELDATIASTTGSGTPGYYISFPTADATKLDENTSSSSIQQCLLVDNGQGTASAAHPVKGGNYVLFKIAESQIPQAAQG